MQRRWPTADVQPLKRRPGYPLLTALAALVAATVLVRPTALLTFGLIALAGSLNSKRQAH